MEQQEKEANVQAAHAKEIADSAQVRMRFAQLLHCHIMSLCCGIVACSMFFWCLLLQLNLDEALPALCSAMVHTI